jgi:3-dehydroquinate synthase II
VDLCSNMVPGEGMLVGSFARGLFLVHSECAESAYINSRPFRVNAGPVSCAVRQSRRTLSKYNCMFWAPGPG